MALVKLDGFTADGLGNVVGAEQDLVDGDVCRNAAGDEFRYYNPGEEPPRSYVKTISPVRFEATFAGAIGNVAYESVLDALKAFAATDPMTEDSAGVRRALRGLNNPAGIDYPFSPWRDPAPSDLTAHFLKLAHDVLIAGDPDIADKIDAGLLGWPTV
jgi:hypothetical protein